MFLKLNLQFFAEADDLGGGGEYNVDNTPEDFSGGEQDLFDALRQLAEADDIIEEPEEELEDDNPEDELEEEEEDETPEEEEEEEEEENPEEEDETPEDNQKGKKKQTPEENAKFAAQRRQRELDQKVQQELERLKAESPEFKLAEMLSKQYGRPADEIMVELQEAALQQEAKEKNLPVELLRERQQDRQQIQSLEEQINQIRYEAWNNKIQADTARLQNEYKFLSNEDFDTAVDYILNTVRNVDLPLEQALYAVHGKKIVETLAQQKLQDDLAEQSGRKKKTPPVSPRRGKTPQAKTLTAEEQYIAKQFGMSAGDYLKYK